MSVLLLPRAADPDRLRLRLLLLFAQALTLGTAASVIIITASSLFLPIFGSQALPYTYLVVAVTGSLAAYGSAEMIRRWSLPRAAIATTSAAGLLLLASWLAIDRGGSRWVPFAMMVLFPFLIQVGFVFLGGQAGRLLDVRQIKRFFPQIVAGFVAGFVLGGLVVPLLVNLLGSAQNVILAIVFILLNLVAFMVATSRSFPEALGREQRGAQPQAGRTLPQLLSSRYVRLVVLYQMMGAMTIQLTEYILMAQAAGRFLDSQALAQFFSQFYVLLNGLDLFVLLVLASLFLRRFGLRAGLLVNPLATAVIFMVLILLGLLDSSTGLAFFFAVSAGRVLNIALEDGATRTSLNAAYQVLPGDERSLVQTAVEGIGAPLALGLVGLLLLLFNRLSGLNILYVVGLTVGLALLWGWLGLLVYRGYAAALLITVRRRVLGRADLSLDDASTLVVVERLLQSEQSHQVILGLDMLGLAEHPSLDDQLLRLVGHPDAAVQLEVLQRLEGRQQSEALPAVSRILSEGQKEELTAASLITFCSLMEPDDLEQVLPFLEHEHPLVRRGAMVGLLRYGGIPGVMAAGQKMQALEQARQPGERLLLAQIIGDVAAGSLYQPLSALLEDESVAVRWAALEAAGRLRHPRLLAAVHGNLADRRTRSAASMALVAFGEKMLPLAAQALAADTTGDWEQTRRLVRLCGQVAGPAAVDLLSRYLDHPVAPLRQEILTALSLCGYRAGAGDRQRTEQMMQQEVATVANILVAREELGQEKGLELLKAALEEEWQQARHRVFLLLSFIYDPQTIMRAEVQLLQGKGGQRAMALELLDLELSASDKRRLFPLIDPRLEPSQRLKQVEHLAADRQDRRQRLQTIIENGAGLSWTTWIRACAVYAAGLLEWDNCVEAVSVAMQDPAFVVRETAVWSLSRLAPGRLSEMAEGLARDGDPRIAALLRQLGAISRDTPGE